MTELKTDFKASKLSKQEVKFLKSENVADTNSTDIINSLVKFDRQKNAIPTCTILPGHLINFDSAKNEALLNPVYPPDASLLISSDTWLKKFGLKTNKLTFENILSMIGFKQPQDYLTQLNRNVSSVYSKGLFLQTSNKNGSTYNITVNDEKLIEYVERLEEIIKLYRARLQWLNSDSRRIFGVIIEQGVCLVLDCKQQCLVRFGQFRNCVLKLLKEQIHKILSFNIIRCGPDKIESFKSKAVVVSAQSIEEAIEWLNEWNKFEVKGSTDTSTCHGVLHAFQDDTIEAVYLISEGMSSNGVREVLYDKLIKESNEKKIRLNVVSYDCTDMDTIGYLRRLATNSYGVGRFHGYCFLRQYDDYIPGPIDRTPTKNKVFVNKRTFGGAPPGAGVKSDLMQVFEEIQHAKEALENLKLLSDTMSQTKTSSKKVVASDLNKDLNKKTKQRDEEYCTSKEWLQKHGLSVKKLDLFDVLNQVSFRHCDGVVELKKEPVTGRMFYVGEGVRYYQGDAIPKAKLVNAKYCDQFAHVLWNDGTIMHVQVTPDLHRNYEKKINILLDQYEKRIDWLSKGSRELFGTVIENNICILIDTSQSMQLSLDFVKRKLATLIQEQLKAKQRFNLLAFNSKIHPWRDRLVEVDEYNLASALEWIQSLNAQGTTNTLAAIRFALCDLNTEAIYLLSDGRPDQDPRQILSQIHLNSRMPIHTISFNCNDSDANKFLSQLARETSGRYHYFNESGWDADPDGPIPYQSEDTSLLKNEIDKGQKYLMQLAALRDECANLSVSKSLRNLPTNTQTINRLESQKENMFHSKYRSKTALELSKQSSEFNKGVLNTLHDIQSLEWVLPETRSLLEKQFRNEMMQSKAKQKSNENIIKKPRSKSSTKAFKSKKFNLDSYVPHTYASKLKKWLDNNSLTELNLSIFDVLRDGDITDIPDDISETNVWKDITNLADSSNVNKSKLNLPSVASLKSYESKLENQIKSYQKYLGERIWSALPDIEKSILKFKEPVFFNNSKREALTKSLEHSNWPVSKSDVDDFENQIELAKTFLRYSRSLRQHLKEENSISKTQKEEDKDSDTDRARSPSFHFESVKEPTKTRVLLKDLGTSRSVTSDNLEELMTTNANEKISRGDKVIARNDLFGYYYTGVISKVLDSRHANIKFEKGGRQNNQSFRNIIKMGSTSSILCLGDYVMGSVLNEFEQQCWVPGIIQSIDSNSFPKLYTVLYFNGQEGENTRPELHRINKNTYGFIVNYIRSRLGMNTNIKPYHEQKLPEAPEPRPPTPPNLDDLKKEIVDSIKVHFDSLKLDDKYQHMYEELLSLRKKHKYFSKELEGKFKVLRNDFDEWKSHEPKMTIPQPQADVPFRKNKDTRKPSIEQRLEEIDQSYIDNPKEEKRASKSERKHKNKIYEDSMETVKESKYEKTLTTKNSERTDKRSSKENSPRERESSKERKSQKKRPKENLLSDREDNVDRDEYKERKSKNKYSENSHSERENSYREKKALTEKEERVRKNSDPNIAVIKAPQPPNELTIFEKLMRLRSGLSRLEVGEEVLARWPDDGWYYKSIIIESLGNHQYKVEDSLKDVEVLFREDIISETNDSANDLYEIGDSVIALHPHYEYSYAPGQIVQISNDLNKILVRFYDFVEGVILQEEVYKMAKVKFQLDVNAIIDLEKRWIGQTVVARNNYSNVYELGKVIERIGNGRQYTIEWSNGSQSIQNAIHMFGAYTKNPSIIVNDYVLAPRETIFIPGRIIGKKGSQLRVKFVDGKIDENINYEDCYWLSRDYYEEACNFYNREIDPYVAEDDRDSSRKSSEYPDGGTSTTTTARTTHRFTNRKREDKIPVIDAKDFHTSYKEYDK